MTELNLGPNFTISHISDKEQCNNMFYQTAIDSNSAAGADVSKKCRLYMSQAEYDKARYDQGGVCANSALVPARFWLNPLVPVDPVGPDPTPSTGIKFSIFGDSISTYAGYIQGYTTYYPYGTLNDVSMTILFGVLRFLCRRDLPDQLNRKELSARRNKGQVFPDPLCRIRDWQPRCAYPLRRDQRQSIL